jgi:hypothetical protein
VRERDREREIKITTKIIKDILEVKRKSERDRERERERETDMATVSGFLTKTFGIFSDSHYEDICGWGPGGDTIQVRKVILLPPHFLTSLA